MNRALNRFVIGSLLIGFSLAGFAACSGGSSSSSGSSGGTTTDDTATSCHLIENTTNAGAANSLGCYMLTRDTTSCQASRTAQGLTGYWLKFSCRVTLTKSGSNVIINTDSRPDSKSQYFETTSACYEAFSAAGRTTNPNRISAKSITMTVPYSPTAAGSLTSTTGATIGVALNGVSIFGNYAAPGDNIYDEAATFDKCEGHPQNTGNYHYHAEPTSISRETTDAEASAFVGVMRDGFPIYGRKDANGTVPNDLDAAGGHTGTTVDSTVTPVYHYHVNYQTDGTDSAYFISTGKWKGTAGTCSGCN